MADRRRVRVHSYEREGRQVRGYTRDQDAAKEQWETRKWQAAAAGISVAIAAAVLLEFGFSVVTMILLLALLGLNALLGALLKPRSSTRRVVRRASRSTTRRAAVKRDVRRRRAAG
jgi:uncharacterized membrane protein